MLYSNYNKDTYPGFHYAEYLGKGKKEQCVFEALKVASKRWDIVSSGNFSRDNIFPSLYMIGARNKRDYDYDSFEKASSRVVHMPEFHAELCSGPNNRRNKE